MYFHISTLKGDFNMSEMKAMDLASRVYYEIQDKANSNVMIQGISGFFGFPITIMADVGVIGTHYIPLFNNIRCIYNRYPVGQEVVTPLISNIGQEVLFDLVTDKVLGNIPVVGVYFNAICAKTMTWRLGILFAMLASRGETVDTEFVKNAMILIRQVFPQNDSFKFSQPDFNTFVKLISSIYENSFDEYNNKIIKALDAFNS